MKHIARTCLFLLFLGFGDVRAQNINVLHAWQDKTIGTSSMLGANDSAIISRMFQEFITLRQALTNSKITNVTLTYVGAVKLPTLTGGSMSELLGNAFDDQALQAAHDATNADTTMLFSQYPSNDFLGITLGPANGGPSAPFQALSAINVSGNLAYYVYQHEWGHQLGAQHQQSLGVSGNRAGSPSTAHGFYIRWKRAFTPITGGTAYAIRCSNTIMAYKGVANINNVDCSGSDGDDNRIVYYSNPYVSIYIATIGSVDYYTQTGEANYANNAAMIGTSAAVVTNNHTNKWYSGNKAISAILNWFLLTGP